MSDEVLKSFLNPNGTTSHAGQTNAGLWQASTRGPLTSQRSWESSEAYSVRADAFFNAKKQSGG